MNTLRKKAGFQLFTYRPICGGKKSRCKIEFGDTFLHKHTHKELKYIELLIAYGRVRDELK